MCLCVCVCVWEDTLLQASEPQSLGVHRLDGLIKTLQTQSKGIKDGHLEGGGGYMYVIRCIYVYTPMYMCRYHVVR